MMRCDPRAYARCETRQYCGECDKFNRAVLSLPLTNADRIQAMTDEELCEFLMCDVICDQNISPDCKDCERYVMAWLRQPGKESDGD